MSTKLLHATLLLGSAGATAAGSYASYGSYYGTGLLSTEGEKPVEHPVPNTQATSPAKQPEIPIASLPAPKAPEVETPVAKTDKHRVEELLKGENFKSCTFKFKVHGSSDYREINQLNDSEVVGLLAFLSGDDKNGLCPKLAGNDRADSSLSREELIDGRGEGKWEQAEDEKTEREKIVELLKENKFKSCTFKFKAKNSNEYRDINALGEDEVAGLYDFLKGDQNNGLCPVMAGQREVGPEASREEKIDAKGNGTWEQSADDEN